jgi:hypothetical protein
MKIAQTGRHLVRIIWPPVIFVGNEAIGSFAFMHGLDMKRQRYDQGMFGHLRWQKETMDGRVLCNWSVTSWSQ